MPPVLLVMAFFISVKDLLSLVEEAKGPWQLKQLFVYSVGPSNTEGVNAGSGMAGVDVESGADPGFKIAAI